MSRPPGASSQALYLVVATGSAQLLVAVSYILAARGTDPGSFGAVAAAIALGTSLIGIVDFGAGSLWVRSLTAGELTVEEVTRRTFWKAVLAVMIATLATAIVIWTRQPPEYIGLGLIFLSSTGAQLAQVPLRAAARSDRIAFAIALSRLSGFGVLIGMTHLQVPSTTALWVSLVVNAAVEMALCLLFTPATHRFRRRSLRLVNPWKGSLHFGVYSVATSAQSLDVPILTLAAGPVAAGAYAAVNRWTQPLGLAVGGFTSASAPFVARARSLGAAWAAIKKATWMLGAALICCVAAFFLAQVLVPLLLGEEYASAVAVFQIMALGTIPALLNQPLAVFSQMRGGDKAVGVVTSLGVAARLAATFLLSAWLGASGGALAFALSQVLLLGGLIIVLVRTARKE